MAILLRGCTRGVADLEYECRGCPLCALWDDDDDAPLSTKLPKREALEVSDWGVGARLYGPRS